jgi:hypothetical protein
MAEPSTPTTDRGDWSVERFERFWSDPDFALVPAGLTDDVVGYWAGRDEPARGKEAYTDCMAALVEKLPGIRFTVAEHAASGEFTFIRWIMNATGEHGLFELTGVNRVRFRDGLVAENVIVFDTAAFEARSGIKVPWA